MGERTQAPSVVHGPVTVKYAEACDAVGEGGGGAGDGGLAVVVEQSLEEEHCFPEQQ